MIFCSAPARAGSRLMRSFRRTRHQDSAESHAASVLGCRSPFPRAPSPSSLEADCLAAVLARGAGSLRDGSELLQRVEAVHVAYLRVDKGLPALLSVQKLRHARQPGVFS